MGQSLQPVCSTLSSAAFPDILVGDRQPPAAVHAAWGTGSPYVDNGNVIVGSVGATLEDLKEAVGHVGKGKLKTVVDSTLPLSRFQEGLDKIKNNSCLGKIVCIP